MPSFDPRYSTTNDVAREAVIPMSRVGQDIPWDGHVFFVFPTFHAKPGRLRTGLYMEPTVPWTTLARVLRRVATL